MRDRVEKREDASSRMELTGLLHVYLQERINSSQQWQS